MLKQLWIHFWPVSAAHHRNVIAASDHAHDRTLKFEREQARLRIARLENELAIWRPRVRTYTDPVTQLMTASVSFTRNEALYVRDPNLLLKHIATQLYHQMVKGGTYVS